VIAAVRRPWLNTAADLIYNVLARAGWRSAAENYSAGTVRQSHRARGARRILLVLGDVWRDGGFCHASLRSPATAGLRQREWDGADGYKQKQIKRASEKMRFDGRVNLFFHGSGVVCSNADLPRCKIIFLEWDTFLVRAAKTCQHFSQNFL